MIMANTEPANQKIMLNPKIAHFSKKTLFAIEVLNYNWNYTNIFAGPEILEFIAETYLKGRRRRVPVCWSCNPAPIN